MMMESGTINLFFLIVMVVKIKWKLNGLLFSTLFATKLGLFCTDWLVNLVGRLGFKRNLEE